MTVVQEILAKRVLDRDASLILLQHLDEPSPFIGRGPIHVRQRHILHPQVDAELTAVMDVVVHHE
jgi:hypothetical protein